METVSPQKRYSYTRTFSSYLDLRTRYLPHHCWIQFSRVDIYLVIRCRDGELADQGQCNDEGGQIIFLP